MISDISLGTSDGCVIRALSLSEFWWKVVLSDAYSVVDVIGGWMMLWDGFSD